MRRPNFFDCAGFNKCCSALTGLGRFVEGVALHADLLILNPCRVFGWCDERQIQEFFTMELPLRSNHEH